MVNINNILRGAVVAMSMAGATVAGAADVTLKFGHFWPAGSRQNVEIFEAWAKAVEEESGGRIDVQVFPSQTLAKADSSYQAVVNGILDVTATAPGYTAGRFPLSQLAELPTMGDTAQKGSCLAQKMYDSGAIADEYKDTHLLFLFTHGPGYMHTVEKQIKQPSDLNGLRIRRPTAVVADMLRKQGASAVGMPAPEVYQSLQRGVLDGLTMPWEGMDVFRLTELTTHAVEVPLYHTVFVMTMNKRVYASLPADLKAVIDNNSGMAWAQKAGMIFDDMDAVGRQKAVERGQTIIGADDPEVAKIWQGAIDDMILSYLDEVSSKGRPAQEVYEKALSFMGDCE